MIGRRPALLLQLLRSRGRRRTCREGFAGEVEVVLVARPAMSAAVGPASHGRPPLPRTSLRARRVGLPSTALTLVGSYCSALGVARRVLLLADHQDRRVRIRQRCQGLGGRAAWPLAGRAKERRERGRERHRERAPARTNPHTRQTYATRGVTGQRWSPTPLRARAATGGSCLCAAGLRTSHATIAAPRSAIAATPRKVTR